MDEGNCYIKFLTKVAQDDVEGMNQCRPKDRSYDIFFKNNPTVTDQQEMLKLMRSYNIQAGIQKYLDLGIDNEDSYNFGYYY